MQFDRTEAPARIIGLLALAMLTSSCVSVAWAQETPVGQQTSRITARELLALADQAADAGDFAVAETAYRALASDPLMEMRNEARYRLALLHIRLRRLAEAAILLRNILDEQPDAQPVRIKLAQLLDQMGDEAGARRALREAQAGGLPPDVARFVDRYSAALRAQKPLGASLDIAFAPDSNINRATRSQTLGTVLGDFMLDDDARQRSGIGVALRGQAYARFRLSEQANLFVRMSGSADLYREGDFNDVALGVSAGPEIRLGRDRLSVELGGLWRWYGGKPYSRAATIGLNYFHPLGRTAQLRAIATMAFVDNRFNPLLDGQTFTASLSYERALSHRAGIGFALGADRQALHYPGYSTWGGQVTMFGYREIGPITLVASISHGRLRADERIAFFSTRRSDRLYRASLAATFRTLRVGSFAPFLRTTLERNRSTIEVYDYRRLRTELGITRAF